MTNVNNKNSLIYLEIQIRSKIICNYITPRVHWREKYSDLKGFRRGGVDYRAPGKSTNNGGGEGKQFSFYFELKSLHYRDDLPCPSSALCLLQIEENLDCQSDSFVTRFFLQWDGRKLVAEKKFNKGFCLSIEEGDFFCLRTQKGKNRKKIVKKMIK